MPFPLSTGHLQTLKFGFEFDRSLDGVSFGGTIRVAAGVGERVMSERTGKTSGYL
jgi:hypothetical protein